MINALLRKDIREHGRPLFALLLAFVIIELLALSQNRSLAHSMGAMQVVRFSLLTTLPMLTIIVGNRLVRREYMSKSRLFVEALPLHPAAPLTIKYVTGLIYLLVLAALCVIVAAVMAGPGDAINARFAALVALKTAVLIWLAWSIVFCFSLCGYLRVPLYLALAGLVLAMIAMPAIEHYSLGPFALLDQEVFAFERDAFPWREIGQTLALAFAFSVAGFALGLINEGSMAEALAKPMSRRSVVAVGVMVMAGLTMFGSLYEKKRRAPYAFSAETVLRRADPPVAVHYAQPAQRVRSERLIDTLHVSLRALQARLGIAELPKVRVALELARDPDTIRPQLVDGVLVKANYAQYDDFDNKMLHTAVLHHAFEYLTNGRAGFAQKHWILDGFSHWWPRINAASRVPSAEMVARAAIANERAGQFDLIQDWEALSDEVGYASSGALAYSALVYLEQLRSADAVVALGRQFLVRRVGSGSIAAFRDRRESSRDQFERISGLQWSRFVNGWRAWLRVQAGREEVAVLIRQAPALAGEVTATTDAAGVHHLQARYTALSGYREGSQGQCVLRHRLASAFDSPILLENEERDSAPCLLGDIAHRISSFYAPGDRALVVLEFDTDAFHRPLRIWAGRINIR